MLARKRGPLGKRAGAFDGDGREGQNVEQNPERLGPQLEAADQCDAVSDQRDDDHRADEIADRAGDAEA